VKAICIAGGLLFAAAFMAGCSDGNIPAAPRVPGADAAVAVQNAGSLVELSRPNAVGTCDD